MDRRKRMVLMTLTALITVMVILLAVILLQGSAAAERTPAPSPTTPRVHEHTPTPLMASNLSPARVWVVHPTSTRVMDTPTITPAPVEEIPEELPDYFYIHDISGHQQWFSIGCEASAAVDWADYFGVPINEREFQTLIPVSDNPDFGFVGDVNGAWGLTPPNDYGVHAAPVAELLRWYGLNAEAQRGMTLEDLRSNISQSKPVIAWVVGNVTYGTAIEYVDKEGVISTVAAYEHVVIVTGYNFESVRYLNNGTSYDVSTKLFMESWGVLGNMAVTMGKGNGEE